MINPTLAGSLINIIDPAIVFNYKRSSILFNPRLIISQKDIGILKSSFGYGIGYQYYFKKDTFRFNYNVLFETSYFKINYNSFPSGFNSTWHGNYFNNEAGIGIKYNLMKIFYINSAITFGLTAFRNIGEHVLPGDPTFYDAGKYKLTKICYFRIGIGYNFIK